MKYDLVGIDGNAWSVIGYVCNAMFEQGFTKAERTEYRKRAMSGDYDNLLCESVQMIDKCNEIAGDEE